MSDQTNENQGTQGTDIDAVLNAQAESQNIPVVDELTALKQRADLMGLSYHPSIGVEKLRIKIAEALQGVTSTSTTSEDTTQEPAKAAAPDVPANMQAIQNEDDGSTKYVIKETPEQKRARIRREANEMVRIRVTCMNPAKKEWHGEIFTVGNAAVGTIKKFVPFNAEEGWHVPRMLLQMMEQRQCQIFVNGKSKNGVTFRQGKLIKEFAIEILPALTEQELRELARRQAMAAGQD